MIFTKALFEGRAGERDAILAEMNAITEARSSTQPVNTRTGGSTFKNPPGAKAWELIDARRLPRAAIGGAQVSELHCNFLINHRRRHLPPISRRSAKRCGGACGSIRASSCTGRSGGSGRNGRLERPTARKGIRGMTKHVAVLLGGLSAEREVSLSTGTACANALEGEGYRVTRIDVGRDVARCWRR